ncbi:MULTISPECIES: GDSL-type esterase/lipase family protein [unclassified Paenibacillus]|uniref:SGNH/GDSL hydrolase family protein n=1 Tax=unclassified Paenibacillus TaxID=185978 RepID=UPI00210C617F|nr:MULTISPECIES: GDSL-type esterase/lipase family protein [unclassified Paenibacillus]
MDTSLESFTKRHGVYLHNVAELEPAYPAGGMRLQRFPREVRHRLTEKGRTKAMQSNGCEVRFVTEAKMVQVTLGALETNGRVLVFRGDFFHSVHELKAGSICTLQLEQPERFSEVSEDKLEGAFAPRVWRLFIDRFAVVWYGIESFGFAVRPPDPAEMPALTMLAYGSSITQGAGATNAYNGYVHQAARRLGIEALNLGLSGSCYCEPELSDYLAARQDWDLAFLEIGVNMRGTIPAEEFERRASYLLDCLIDNHPGKPVFVTIVYPNRATYFREANHVFSERERRYNEVLAGCVESRRREDLHLLDGARIMSDFTSLTSDLIHPSDYGHQLMGENVANMLRPTVERLIAAGKSQFEGGYAG